MIRKEMKYTDEQGKALDLLAKKTNETYAEMVRRLIADEAARLGIDFPQNMLSKQETIKIALEKRWPKDEKDDTGT